MKKLLIYDKYDETYREVIDVKELEEYILKRIEEVQQRRKNDGECELALHGFQREAKIEVLQSFLKDLEVEDD